LRDRRYRTTKYTVRKMMRAKRRKEMAMMMMKASLTADIVDPDIPLLPPQRYRMSV
jgi:hypothetical protein